MKKSVSLYLGREGGVYKEKANVLRLL